MSHTCDEAPHREYTPPASKNKKSFSNSALYIGTSPYVCMHTANMHTQRSGKSTHHALACMSVVCVSVCFPSGTAKGNKHDSSNLVFFFCVGPPHVPPLMVLLQHFNYVFAPLSLVVPLPKPSINPLPTLPTPPVTKHDVRAAEMI